MLNERQAQVVRHHGKPLLVVAGAGSGKTKTIAHKVEFILQNLLPEDRILCITFTNKASKEIKERVFKVTGRELPWVGTFHSVAYRILKAEGYSFSIAGESETKSLLTGLMRTMDISREDYDKVKRAISRVKEDLGYIKSETLRELFEAYQQALRENNLFDFSDLMFELYNLLKEQDSVREKWRKRFGFILVDEYQDTNTVQYEILKLLAGKDICVVGDPNQCIYEWRFAKPQNILRFIEDFNPDVIKLETNYRSGGYILEVANAVLKGSKASWKNLIPTLVPVKEEGEKPVVRRFPNEEEEALWIVQEIKELLRSYQPKDIAILVRTSYITDPIESALFRANVPYRVVGTLRFYERAEIKNMLSILRLFVNPADSLAFEKLCTYVIGGVGRKTIEKLKEGFGGSWISALEDLGKRSQRLMEFVHFWKELEMLADNYPEVIRKLVQETPYIEAVLRKHKGDPREREENIKELIRTAREKYKEGLTLEEFLNEASLLSSEEVDGNGVSIMTIHSAKGLEFDVVFLPRLEEEVLPHRSALEDEEELEEERRLFYVAVTRAKDRLYLSYTKAKGRKPSRFLSDIPKGLLNLEHFKKKKNKVSYSVELRPNGKVKAGVMVHHKVFGIGRVISVEGERAKVDFMGKEKSIHTSFLEVVD